MPDSMFPKKRPRFDSVDGMLPQPNRQLPKSTTHQYYRSSGLNRPDMRRSRRPAISDSQPSRRRPHQPEPGVADKETEEKAPLVGDFSASRGNIFDDAMMKDRPEKARKRDRKEKKEKKPGRLRTWWKNRSRKFKFGLVSSVIVIVGVGMLGLRLYSFLNSVFARGVGNSSSAALGDNVRPEDLNTEGDGRLNVLMLGRGGTENEAPDLTDTLLIASIDLKNQNTALFSVPRDMWVTANGSSMKINAVFATSKQAAQYKGKSDGEAEDEGVRSAIAAVRNVAGVPIHKYVLTDYKAFRDVVNALGGVDINVEESIYDGFTGWSFKAGQQTMNGDKALQYARTRHGSARGDFDRNQNQRQLLVAMRQKATSTGIVTNPVRLNSLANAVQKNIRTDLTVDEAKTLFNKTKNMADSSIVSLDLAKEDEPLVQTGNIGGQSIVMPTAGLTDFSKIRAYARSNMIDPYLKQESPTVAVYNGTGKAGIASTVADVLSGYGYKVLAKDTSQTDQSKTMVIKMTKTDKPFTNRFLSLRFATSISNSLPDNVVPPKQTATTSTDGQSTEPEPDYIIILGSDFKTPSGPTW